MAIRPAKQSLVSLNEDGVSEAYVFPLSASADIGSDQPLVDVPLYRGSGELMDAILSKSTGSGAAPTNLDTHFFPRFLTVLFGRDAYTKNQIGVTAYYTHKWGIGEPLLSNLQMDSLSPSTLTHVLEDVLPGGFSLAGAVTGPAVYNAAFVASGKESTTAIDATPTLEPFAALSSLNGEIKLDGTTLGAVVTEFSLQYSTDIQTTDPYFYPYQTLVGAGDYSIRGQLTILYENEDYYQLAITEARPSIECTYANKPMDQTPTQWVKFTIEAARLSKGMPRMGVKVALMNRQEFRAMPYDAAGDPASFFVEVVNDVADDY
jgi:hypothetical protein